MNVRPLHDWVVVKLEPEQVPSTILAIPDTHDEVVRKGVVLAVGPGFELSNGVRDPVGVAPGDKVCFARWHQEHRSGKAQVDAMKEMGIELGASVVLVRRNDILFAYEGDALIEVVRL